MGRKFLVIQPLMYFTTTPPNKAQQRTLKCFFKQCKEISSLKRQKSVLSFSTSERFRINLSMALTVLIHTCHVVILKICKSFACYKKGVHVFPSKCFFALGWSLIIFLSLSMTWYSFCHCIWFIYFPDLARSFPFFNSYLNFPPKSLMQLLTFLSFLQNDLCLPWESLLQTDSLPDQ